MGEVLDFFQIGWLNAIREWQEEFVGNMSSREFVDTVTRDLLGSRVFVFTPRGEIKNLPKGATIIDYAYMIHTEIGNKMVAAKVNGNIVSPTHVLANAEVVEIITYNALSGKSAYQRHKQWLQHAKTRSARHKIMKFLREQAALSAAEITADTITDFIADSEEESETEEPPVISTKKKALWEKILDMVDISSTRKNIMDSFQAKDNKVSVPKVNGKHNHYVNVKLKAEGDILSMGNGVARIIQTLYKEVLPGLDSWQTSKITSWHSLEGHSIQWLCVICIDRRGIMGEVTTELAAAGITICSCVAEMDRGRGMAVMLFHVEGNLESVVNACTKVDTILGVLGWSTGCSWPNTVENQKFLEC
ncbi:putative GTP diphosphokinase RSH1, chloroplastic, partial [Cucurbita argyrosperma subsp. argyrosperma]